MTPRPPFSAPLSFLFLTQHFRNEYAEQSADDTGSHRPAKEETDFDRDVGARCPGEGVPRESEADQRGDHIAGRPSVHGEGGGSSVVLQSPSEGEANQPARPVRQPDRQFGRKRKRKFIMVAKYVTALHANTKY